MKIRIRTIKTEIIDIPFKPTHKISFYGVRCWYNDNTGDLCGVNWLCDYLVMAVSWLHNFVALCFPGVGERGFPFRVIEEYEEQPK